MDSSFHSAVYQTVAAIPAGRVCSYGQVAARAGAPNHARQVGRLMRTLPRDTRLPWHRVVRADGSLAVQDGRQHQRLQEEGITLVRGRVPRTVFW